MSFGNVNDHIIKQMDRFAKMKKTIKDTLDTYTASRFWILIDHTNNELYENRVKGSQITAMDGKLNEAKIGGLSQDWFTLHSQYFSNDLGLTGGLSGFLNSIGIRVHEDFANVYFESTNSRLTPKFIYADEEKEENILYNNISGQEVAARSLNSFLGDTRLKIVGNGTLTNLTVGTTNNLTIAFSSNLPATDGSEYIGESAASSVAVGDNTITLNTSGDYTNFVVGQYVLIENTNDTTVKELVQLHANTAPSSSGILTLAAGTTVKYDYTSGANIYPLYNKVSEVTVASGNIKITPSDDRIITWGEDIII